MESCSTIRDSDVVTLFVDTAHPRVEARYESRGYRQVDESKPFEGSPWFAVMLRDLLRTAV